MENPRIIPTEEIDQAHPVKLNNQIIKEIIKELQIKGNDNELYNLKIFLGDNSILFLVKIQNNINNIIYKKELTIKEFHNTNEYFRQYLTCAQLFNALFCNVNNLNTLILKENNNVKIEFSVEQNLKKEKISFILNRDINIINNIIWNLYERIKIVEEKNITNEKILNEIENNKINFEKEIKNKEVENKIEYNNKSFILYLFNILNKNKNKLSIFIFIFCFFIQFFFVKKLNDKDKVIFDLNKEIINIKQYINDFQKNKIPEKKKSNIITNGIIKPNELYLIEDEIRKKFNKNITNYKLIFRASRDGYKAKNFHEKCDGKSNTLTLIKTKTKRRFGGFTEDKWENNRGYKNGKKGFIFSLDDKEIYYNKDGNYNIYCNSTFGPSFRSGPHDFTISDNCNMNNESFEYIQNSKDNNEKNYILEGNEHFIIKDYEVYIIEME